jgi:hypothetical protein
MILNSQLGAWEIRMAAAHGGMTARASIQQINAAPVEAMAAGGKRSRSLYWLAAGSRERCGRGGGRFSK